ncbi:LysR family transcriptional regulator [Edaphobacter albus]|uniref:LysR family transcriptional regulator n=1 Tax=Edaphobacter sp. 4G125 TaxID=2763071 RepID=UPI0016484F3F|nr:LysR family transcriptional regulator [Edaphobacter sp. 4G125]QNI35884.1 LysR family transcriptional regulator [Edaphobacter sp. 4G125]
MSLLVDIRLQMAAVTLAEEMNFTRAADRLRITQPALSKQIAELESRLGFVVFERDQKHVELTEAGQVFVRGCKDSLAILEKAIRTARATQEEIQPVVTIGHSPYVCPVLVSALLSVNLPLYPSLRLRMESRFASELVHSVLSAELDIALLEEPIDSPLLTLVPLVTAPLHAVMSLDHPAAQQRSVSIEDFTNVGWMMFPKKANPALYDRLFESAKQLGVSPIELHHYMTPQEVVQLISENFGVAFMPPGVAEQIAGNNFVSRPLTSKALEFTSYLALRADQSSRLVNEFGRAFLKKAVPNGQHGDASGQMSLKL